MNCNIKKNHNNFVYRAAALVSATLIACILLAAVSIVSYADNSTVTETTASSGTTATGTTSADSTTATTSEPATELTPTITLSNGGSISNMTDGSYSTRTSFASGDTITITCSEAMYALYIKWDLVPDTWTLSYNGKTVECGTNGFLHEYVEMSEGTTSATITFASSEAICNLSVYSQGSAADGVQTWNAPCDNADILVFATHADDEILFLGGVLATYGGQQQLAVQIAYMCEFTSTAKIREHEKLDGLWECGINHYPVCGNFTDLYSTTLETANTQYSYDEITSYVTSTIRRFKPLVVVTQDLDGEYGHGGHMIYSHAVAECVGKSNDATFYPESAAQYGTWDVPKTYLHLYSENKITLDLRQPLSNLGGRTSIEVQEAAYKWHVSQQWCWFYVSDDYEYSCADFGLYRTTVGYDTGNDMLENITTYEEQARIAAAEAASREAEEAASIAAEQESLSAAEAESLHTTEAVTSTRRKATIVIIVVIACAVFGFLGYMYAKLLQARKRKHIHGHHKHKHH